MKGFFVELEERDALEEELLKHSNGIRLEDDLTFIEIRFNHF